MIDPGQAAHKLLMRIKTLFLRNRAGDELHDELQFHLELQIAEISPPA